MIKNRMYNPTHTKTYTPVVLGAGLITMGVAVASVLGYNVIRKIGENVFGKKEEEQEEEPVIVKNVFDDVKK